MQIYWEKSAEYFSFARESGDFEGIRMMDGENYRDYKRLYK